MLLWTWSKQQLMNLLQKWGWKAMGHYRPTKTLFLRKKLGPSFENYLVTLPEFSGKSRVYWNYFENLLEKFQKLYKKMLGIFYENFKNYLHI